MEVHVTQDHIDRGGKGVGYSAVELALKEAGFRGVTVGSRNAEWLIENLPKQDGYTGKYMVWALPLEVRQFLHAADNGQPIEPFTFTVPPEFSPIPTGGTP